MYLEISEALESEPLSSAAQSSNYHLTKCYHHQIKPA
jgi:hypothetical protein